MEPGKGGADRSSVSPCPTSGPLVTPSRETLGNGEGFLATLKLKSCQASLIDRVSLGTHGLSSI